MCFLCCFKYFKLQNINGICLKIVRVLNYLSVCHFHLLLLRLFMVKTLLLYEKNIIFETSFFIVRKAQGYLLDVILSYVMSLKIWGASFILLLPVAHRKDATLHHDGTKRRQSCHIIFRL